MRERFPRVYAILDASLLTIPPEEMAVRLADAGVKLLQYRDKRGSSRAVFDTALKIVHRLQGRGARLIVNDRADIAALAGAGGTHVGQEDLSPDAARMLCPAPMWVGVSTHNLEQLRAANATTTDYIALGPIFTTQTKENPEATVGVNMLREARALTEKPLVAIGGITAENAAEVFGAGADCVAVARGLLAASNPELRAQELLLIAASARRS